MLKSFSRAIFCTSVVILAATLPARASSVLMLPIDSAMATPEAKGALDGSVKFYFGNSPHPAVIEKYGDFVTNEKTNDFAKSDVISCQRAFLSALIKFQRRAEQLGANAVINIHSYYRRRDVSSETQVECHAGFLMSGVALKGDFVKLSH